MSLGPVSLGARAASGLAAALAVAVLVTAGVQVAADMRLDAPAPTAFVTDRNGTFLTQAGHEIVQPGGGRQVEYGYWPVDPPAAVTRATLALEDRRFWSHPGVDPLAVARAVWQHLRGGHGSGGSTLAMQVVRMQHPRPRTLWSKAIEAGAALGITLRYGRAAVLSQYLRLAPYGEGSHGIAHAARWYFDRPAADLDLAQAALICAVPQAPGLLSLRAGRLERTQARARRAVLAMALSAADQAAALQELATLAPRPAPRRPADLLAALRLQRMAAGQGGPILRATLDLSTQDWVTRRAVQHLRQWQPDGAQQVAVMVLRRADRAVLADVGSAGIATRPGGAIDFTRALRSPGSTLKPFLYALGLERGLIAPDGVVADLPQGAGGINNADHDYLGPLLPRQALANSRNVPATNLLRRIGLPRAFAFLRRLGLHRLDGPAERFGLAMAIGALPTSLERLMRAYATLADDGQDRGLAWFAPSLFAMQAVEPRQLIPIGPARRPLPQRPDGAPAELPPLRLLRVPRGRGTQDRDFARISRRLDPGVVARLPSRRVGGPCGCRAHEPAERCPGGGGARPGHHAAAARAGAHRPGGR